MAYPPAFLDELRHRTTLSDLIGAKVKLVRAGRGEQRGLCPFHSERTASFYVVDDKEMFICFGCGVHGDAITWIERTEGLEFREAVERLAELAGMGLPKQSAQERAKYERQATLHEVLEGAAGWFERRLKPDTPAWEYLRRRGLEEATIRSWRLGWAPDAWRALRTASTAGNELLFEAGLIRQPESGGEPYDFFRSRIIFPITDRRGRVIAFTGRSLDPDAGPPKYLNSPESPLFRKGDTLYGVAAAMVRPGDRDRPGVADQHLLVVEGPTDVLSLAQAGLAAVAPLGTAVTPEHVKALWRLSPRPVCCFDGDTAGLTAATRVVKITLPLLRPPFSLAFARLPNGEDPDSLIRGGGRAAMDRVLAGAVEFGDFLFHVRAALHPNDTPERRADLRRRLEADCAAISDETVRSEYRAFVASKVSTAPAVTQLWHSASPAYARPRLEALFRSLADLPPNILSDIAEDLALLDLDSAPDLARLRTAMLAGNDWRTKLHNGLTDAAEALLMPPIGVGFVEPEIALAQAHRMLKDAA